jgi:hypothetical protein
VVAAASVVSTAGISEELGLLIPDGLLERAPYSEAWGVAETGFALLVKDVVAERVVDLEILG